MAGPEEKKKEKKEKVEEVEEAEEEGTLASPGMPADHERCRYDGFTFYSLPTGRFTATAPSTSLPVSLLFPRRISPG